MKFITIWALLTLTIGLVTSCGERSSSAPRKPSVRMTQARPEINISAGKSGQKEDRHKHEQSKAREKEHIRPESLIREQGRSFADNKLNVPSLPLEDDLLDLVKKGELQITTDGSLDIFSVFGLQQNAYECWIHAPFNAWQLSLGKPLTFLASSAWKNDLAAKVKKFREQEGIISCAPDSSKRCFSKATDLQGCLEDHDFGIIDVQEHYMGITPKRGLISYSNTNDDLCINLHLVLFINEEHLKKDYGYFNTHEGKEEIEGYRQFLNNCLQAISENQDNKYKNALSCAEMLLEKRTVAKEVKSLIDTFLAGNKSNLESIITHSIYAQVMDTTYKRIKRFRSGNNFFGTLGFNNRSEYPKNHAVAIKIKAPDASEITIVNSREIHIGAIKSLKALRRILTLPLPEELPL